MKNLNEPRLAKIKERTAKWKNERLKKESQ